MWQYLPCANIYLSVSESMTDASVSMGLKEKILKAAAGVFGLRLFYTGITFVTSVLFARLLGTSGFGTYSYVIVWAYLLSIPATMGFDNFVVKELSVYRAKSSWALMNGLLTWVNSAVFAIASTVALVATSVAWLLTRESSPETFWAFAIAMLFMPALSLRNTRRGAMRGLDHTVKGLIPELLIDPLILITLTVVAYTFLRSDLSALWVVAFYGIGTTLTLILLSGLLTRALPIDSKRARASYRAKSWITGAVPFMLIESIPLINAQTDVLMLGAFQGVDAVGLYVPVNRAAQIIGFGLMAAVSTLAPTIAKSYADGKLAELQPVITNIVRAMTGVSFLIAGIFIVGGRWYLMIFGPEFLAGQRAMSILCVGQFVATSIGLSAVVLNMTGHERLTANLGWGMAVSNIVLNALLIPKWGVEGAAIATSISTIGNGVAALYAVRKKLGVDMTVIGLPMTEQSR